MASKANEETSKYFNLKELKSVDYVYIFFVMLYNIYFDLKINIFLNFLIGF